MQVNLQAVCSRSHKDTGERAVEEIRVVGHRVIKALAPEGVEQLEVDIIAVGDAHVVQPLVLAHLHGEVVAVQVQVAAGWRSV